MAREKVLCGKEEIIRAAVRIVDSEGMEALSARRISKELGVSAMTIYNYVENLAEVKKYVLSDGFDRLYDSIYHALNELRGQVDKVKFCKTIAMQVFQFASENRNIFIFMFFEGRSQFREDAEIRPFYNFIAKLSKRSKATQRIGLKTPRPMFCWSLTSSMRPIRPARACPRSQKSSFPR